MGDDLDKIERRLTPSESRERAANIADELVSLAADVRRFPRDKDEARVQLAVRNVDAAITAGALAGGALTREQLIGAVLLGQGLTYAEAARALAVDESHIHLWDRRVPGFRAEVATWREHLEQDMEGLLYTGLARLVARWDDLKPIDQIRLGCLMQKIAEKPELRARWSAEYHLKKEQIDLQRAELEANRDAADEAGSERVSEVIDRAEDDIYDGVFDIEGQEDADL